MSNINNTAIASRIAMNAQGIARRRRNEFVQLEHLLLALLTENEVQDVLLKMEVPIDELSSSLEDYLDTVMSPTSTAAPVMTPFVTETLQRADAQSQMTDTDFGPNGVLLAMFVYGEDSFAVKVLHSFHVTGISFSNAAGLEYRETSTGRRNGGGDVSKISTAEDAVIVIEKYARNLNEDAKSKKIDPLIGRQDVVSEVVQTMARRNKTNAMLLGEPGVGKTAIAEGLAKLIVEGDVPEVIRDCTVYNLDITALKAGTRYRGDLEERVAKVIEALEFLPNAIVFIDEVHSMVSEQSDDISNMLKPALSRGKMRVIASTTKAEFRKHFEKDRALVRRFHRIDVEELSMEVTLQVLNALKPTYEDFHGIQLGEGVLERVAEVSHLYMRGVQPDKSIDLLDATLAFARIGEEKPATIEVNDVDAQASRLATIPVDQISADDMSRLTHLSDDLSSVVFGQQNAVDVLTDAVFVASADIRDYEVAANGSGKPRGVFLFAGPTGVGKTELARQLSKTLGKRFVRINMSEYSEHHTISNLIGSPPGYVGYGDGETGQGVLINAMEANDNAVVLLDEIEKAHPSVFNILLQVFEDGTLTSRSGKTVSFRNSIIIMTSNAGATESASKKIGFGRETEYGDPTDAIKRVFSPELRNRFDSTVIFKPLDDESITRVVDKFLGQLMTRLAEKNITMTVSEDARKLIAAEGFDPAMGARPLGRKIDELIKRPLARLMTIGRLKDGGEIDITVNNGKIVVE